MTSIRLLGLDIGGTSSRARVVVDGAVVAEAQAASASLTAAGSDSAAAALAELLAQLPLDDPFDAVCAGSAGSNVPGAEEFLADRLAPLTRTGTVIVVNDAMLVLPAAGLDEGVAVICGTGSIAVGAWRGRSLLVHAHALARRLVLVPEVALALAARLAKRLGLRSGALGGRRRVVPMMASVAPRSRGAILIKMGLSIYDYYGSRNQVMPRQALLNRRSTPPGPVQMCPSPASNRVNTSASRRSANGICCVVGF